MKEALVAIILVLLMYIPYALGGALKGAALYTYWVLIALATLSYAWLATRRWQGSE